MASKKKYGCTLSEMQANLDTLTRSEFYFRFLLCADELMFTWGNLPDTIDEKHLEDYLNISGSCAFAKAADYNYYIAPYAGRTGQSNQYGEGRFLESCTPNGITLKGEIGVDCAIIYNNPARIAQCDLMFDSFAYTEIDKSSNSNVLFSRIAPIFYGEDDKAIEQIKNTLEQILAGNLQTVVSENQIKDITLPQKGDSDIKTVEITHPEKIQYLQYLSEYYDIITRRHFARRGLTLKTSAKHAQVSQDEVHGQDSVSWFYPLAKLKARRDAVAIINKIFGLNITVDFSEIWKQEYNAYLLRILKTDDTVERGVKNVLDSVDDSGNTETEPENVQTV